MIFFKLIIQDWKKNFRSQGFYKNLMVGLLLTILALYIAAVLLFIGFSLDELTNKISKIHNSTGMVCGAMLYILMSGILIRFVLQQLTTINLPPYQVLPIKRDSLINFLLIKPLTNPFNYSLLFVFIPFSVDTVIQHYGLATAIRLNLVYILIVWFNSLSTSFLKRRFGSSALSYFFLFGLMGGLIALDYYKLFSLFELSSTLFMFIINNNSGILLMFVACVVVFSVNKLFFYSNYYPEKFNKKIKARKVAATDLSFLNNLGPTGDLITLQIKLIIRHKRTRTLIYTSVILLFYGLLFYTSKIYMNQYAILFFGALFSTGVLMFTYGQWIIGWNSNHFDCILTRNISSNAYMKANHIFMTGMCVLSFILTTPYFLFGNTILYMHLTAFLFNVGFNSYILLFLSTYNTQKIDLSHLSALNYQGTTYKNFLAMIPVFLLPVVLIAILSAYYSYWIALVILSSFGVIGILLRNPLLRLCTIQFNKRKYRLAEGFRKTE